MSHPTLAFVVPWYGAAITGGAEMECRKTAEQLARRGYSVEVLTTCGLQFHSDWGKNYHRPGTVRVNEVTVRRFKVCPRDAGAFHAINLRLMRGYPISPDDEMTFMRQMINSGDLQTYITTHQSDYRFIFVPYMFGTTYWGAQIAPHNSYIIPCLHDEAYARMQLFKPVMQNVRGLILHSQVEYELARSLYAIPNERLFLLGEGVDTYLKADPDRFRKIYQLQGPFVVYLGRRDETKNTPLLLEYFMRFKSTHNADLKLVMIGRGPLPDAVRARGDIIDAGVVDEQTKADALAAALCLCNPSVHESFSLAVMESWEACRPVLVHADCAVTVAHCRSSHGGLYFRNYAEFEGCLQWLLDHPQEAMILGQQGQAYVRTNYGWDKIVKKLVGVLYQDVS